MSKLKALKETRADIHAQMKAIEDKADARTGAIQAESRADYDRLKGEFDTVSASIQREEGAAKRAMEINQVEWRNQEDVKPQDEVPVKSPYSQSEIREIDKIRAQYSVLEAIRRAAGNRRMDGVYAEMEQVAEKEAGEMGIKLEGHVRMPSFLVGSMGQRTEKRDLVTGTNTAGGFSVQTDVQDLIPILEPRLVTQRLGATYMTGLRGNVSFPRNNADITAGWVAETGDTAQSEPTLDNVTLSPKRLGCWAVLNKNLINQTSISIEQFVRQRMNFAVAKALDIAAIRGSGTSNQPLGIFSINGSNVGVAGTIASGNILALGANGAAVTWANIVALETLISEADANLETAGLLMSPALAGKLKVTAKDAGSGLFLFDGNNKNGTVNMYPAIASTLVPKNLSKGTSNSILSAAIMGDWSELMIGQWAGIDMVVDPYTLATKASIKLVINSWWDVNVKHGAAFSAILDATN